MKAIKREISLGYIEKSDRRIEKVAKQNERNRERQTEWNKIKERKSKKRNTKLKPRS